MGRVACQGPARPYKIWNLHLTIPPNGVSGSRKLVYFNTCGTLHADQFGQMQRNCEIDNACIRIWPMQRNRVADLKRAPHHTVMQCIAMALTVVISFDSAVVVTTRSTVVLVVVAVYVFGVIVVIVVEVAVFVLVLLM